MEKYNDFTIKLRERVCDGAGAGNFVRLAGRAAVLRSAETGNSRCPFDSAATCIDISAPRSPSCGAGNDKPHPGSLLARQKY